MKISELAEKISLTLLTDNNYADREVCGCYIGDLLSRVMGKAQSGEVWITIMNNINIVAVASLADVSCIVLCEDVKAEESVIRKADSEGITIFSSNKTAYELAALMSGEI